MGATGLVVATATPMPYCSKPVFLYLVLRGRRLGSIILKATNVTWKGIEMIKCTTVSVNLV